MIIEYLDPRGNLSYHKKETIPRGSIYTTIMEAGPKTPIPFVALGTYFLNGSICGAFRLL